MSSDSITLLKAASGKRATKLWTATTIEPYDAGWSFSFQSAKVRGIANLSKLLTKIESDPRTFIIRGQVKPLEEIKGVTPPTRGRPIVTPEGRINRWNEAVNDEPLHSMLIDIDGFRPTGVDPVKEPVAAIEQYIAKYLPVEFAGRSFHWQLSSSAGAPGKENILKAHVWFWLETPYPSHVLREWANPRRPQVDASPYQSVQVHYTANPLFEEGVVDPVVVRSGFHEGWLDDSVPLVIDEVTLARAAAAAENKETGRDLKDPKEKAGPIGAFHRAFSMQELLETHLAEHFEPGSKENRLTWTGGNSPEGAFITDDEEHIYITNNTSPLEGPVNKFDLIRHFMFGHLDEGLDPFEIMDMNDKPSYQAAMTFICDLPEVQAELAKENAEAQASAVSLRDQLCERIKQSASETDLRTVVCLEVQRHYKELDKADIKILAKHVKDKFAALGAGAIGIDDARQLLLPPRRELSQNNGGLPAWAAPYVYVTNRAQIYRYDSNEWLSRDAFDFKHNPDAGLDADGNQISAYALLRDGRGITRVEQAVYMPQMPATFTLDGATCVNTYRPSSVPTGKLEADWTPADRAAVRRCLRHLELICGGRKPVLQNLMDWLAFNVQHPGVKITYTWLIVGGEGVGKTWVGQMMSVAMGGPNVRIVSGQEVLNPTFNGWAEGAAFIIIEEVRVHGHKQDSWDNLKAPLTNPVIVIVRKGKDGYNVPNTANYLLLSNHDDAVPVTMGSRRVGVIKTPFDGDDTAKQLHEMAVAEGFESSSAYFDALFAALNEHPEAIRGWLANWPISSEFNPTGRAPETDEREAMILNSRSLDEVEIRDAIEGGGHGVTRSVVSPKHLKTLLTFTGESLITPERLTFHLRKLGYTSYGHQLKWRGEVLRVWTKGVKLGKDTEANNSLLRKLLDESNSVTSPGASDGESFMD
jgi:hypothetical protein